MRYVLISLFAGSFLAGLLLFMPLSAVLRLAGTGNFGISWTSATGTVSGGKVSHLRAYGALIGDAALSLRPAGLLRLALVYSVTWSGPYGSGTGRLEAGAGGHLALADLRIDLSLSRIEPLPAWMRPSGGAVTLKGDLIRFANGRCLAARGTVSSNALSLTEAYLGSGWSDLAGEIRCEGDRLILPLIAENTSGTRISAEVILGPEGQGTLNSAVHGPVAQDLRQLLPLAGFLETGTGFVYQLKLDTQDNLP